ncbi:MAG: FHA domain-containing protein [Planctomycetota bacterium]|nr:FHA domain-containing protein [Planctomycetota bacterium]
MECKKYNLRAFRELHTDGDKSAFVEKFSEPFLYIVEPEGSGRFVFPLPDKDSGRKLFLGTSEASDISLESEKINPKHLKIFHHAIIKAWCIEDQDTRFGTKLNGDPVRPLAVQSLSDETMLEVGEYKIRLYSVSRMAELVFSAPEKITKKAKAAKATTNRLARKPKGKKKLADKEEVRKFLDLFTMNQCRTLLPLAMESRYLEDDEFLEKHNYPFLFLETVKMQKGKAPLYDFSGVHVDQKVFWPLQLLGERKELVLGRSRSCEIFLQAKVVSKKHATFRKRDEGWEIQDHGSVNRTYLDDHAIPRNESKILKDMTVVSVSPHIKLRYYSSKSVLDMLSNLEMEFDF